jgi:hypothetical protein
LTAYSIDKVGEQKGGLYKKAVIASEAKQSNTFEKAADEANGTLLIIKS